nr:hypothetical protein [Shewanella shenzhenensis]
RCGHEDWMEVEDEDGKGMEILKTGKKKRGAFWMQEVKNQPCSSIKVEKQRVQRKKELLNRKKKNLRG